ncbi:MAG: DUF1320 family protein [Lentisphaerae bacterium]|nr:DUF1320 family protein [Lentisphaerota bacterium]
MSWSALTETEVTTRLTGAEVTALKSAALAAGQTDPLPEIVQQAVDEVRGYIAACRTNTLGAAGTIPSRLISAALALIRYRLATRLPVKALLTEDRVKENEAAIRLLERVASCDFVIEDPVTEDTESNPAPAPNMKEKHRHFKRRDQSGL